MKMQPHTSISSSMVLMSLVKMNAMRREPRRPMHATQLSDVTISCIKAPSGPLLDSEFAPSSAKFEKMSSVIPGAMAARPEGISTLSVLNMQ